MGKKGEPQGKKLLLWKKFYLDESNSRTFLNKTQSAIAAGYCCKSHDNFAQVGCQNFNKLKEIIGKWLDEHGLSDSYLKQKLKFLLEAKETKFFAYEGKVTDQREKDALEIQRRTLDMAMKVKGLYAPEEKVFKHKFSELSDEELAQKIKELQNARK